jgi:hypothetical protein
MPRLIPPERGNGKRPSDPRFEPAPESSVTGVVVLDVSEDTHELVGVEHEAALDPDSPTQLLTGAIVQIDNQRPIDSDIPGPVTVRVGGSTLHEAATEVIGCYANLARDMPEWVASSDAQLAAVVAEHFTVPGYSICKVIDMSEVSA